jgi:hypothetical protein
MSRHSRWLQVTHTAKAVHSSGGLSLVSYRGCPGSSPLQVMWDMWGESDTGAGFLRVLQFPLPILIPPTTQLSPIVREWWNRSVSGRHTNRTQSHPTPRKQKTHIYVHSHDGALRGYRRLNTGRYVWLIQTLPTEAAHPIWYAELVQHATGMRFDLRVTWVWRWGGRRKP